MRTKWFKRFEIGLLIVGVGLFGLLVFNVRTPINAAKLADAYHKDKSAADKEYRGASLRVHGRVLSTMKSPDGHQWVTLEGIRNLPVRCKLQLGKSLGRSEFATLQGRCEGLNYGDLRLVECQVVKAE